MNCSVSLHKPLYGPDVIKTWSEKPAQPICYIIPPHMSEKLEEHQHQNPTTHRNHNHNIREHRSSLCHSVALHSFAFLKAQESIPSFSVYTANNEISGPVTLVRKGTDTPTNDPEVNAAFDGAQGTWNFYQTLFDRNSVDSHGMNLKSVVHYGKNYDNAFWDGRQMVYGNGDGTVFNSFTTCLDVIGHELTHGITQYLSNLAHQNEQGALNEHLSDAFGLSFKHWKITTDAKAAGRPVPLLNDLIGEGLIMDVKNKHFSLRSLASPGKAYVNHPVLGTDPQPATMDAYLHTKEDNGGVHINSGIPNHAFWLVHTQLEENLWGKPAQIWYDAATKIKSTTNFKEFANETISSAQQLFGKGSKEEAAVQGAWKTVKVL